MATKLKINDAGDELSFKRKGIKGTVDSKKQFVNWMTKVQFNKANPESVIDWQSFRDAGATVYVVSLAKRYYRGLHNLRSNIESFSGDLEDSYNADPSVSKESILEDTIKKYELYLKDSYKTINDMVFGSVEAQKEINSSESEVDKNKVAKEFVLAIQNDYRKKLQAIFHESIDSYGLGFKAGQVNYRRNRSAISYYLRPVSHVEMHNHGSDDFWSKIISPKRVSRAKGDDGVERPRISIFNAEYTGDIEIPDISESEWPEFMVSTFGLKGIEFGTWNNQGERLKFIHECCTGLMEMSNVLDVNPVQIGLGGRLGLAIGARGRGKAAAHFSGVSKDEGIINLTRTKGVGALAHEYGHALDFFGYKASKSIEGTNGLKYLTDTNAKNNELFTSMVEGLVPVTDKSYFEINIAVINDKAAILISQLKEKLKPEQGKSYLNNDDRLRVLGIVKRVASYIPVKEKSGYNYDYESNKDMNTMHNELYSILEKAEKKSTITHSFAQSIYDRVADLSELKINKNKLMHDLSSLPLNGTSSEAPDLSIMIPEGESVSQKSWYSQSISLDGGRAKKYWSTGKEKWARLFETWVYHKLNDKGIKHDTLVSGVLHKDYVFNKCPYPTKEDGSLESFLIGMDKVIIEDKLFSDALIEPSPNELINDNKDVDEPTI